MAFDFLQASHVGYFLLMLLFFILTFFIGKKFPKTIKVFFSILCYLILPLALLGLVLRANFIQGEGATVFERGRVLGYQAIWLLFLILLVKPLSLLLIGKQKRLIQGIHTFVCFVMRWRRQFGILMFYLAFAHGLIYILFWMQTTSTLFGFFDPLILGTGLVALLACLVPYLTSNDYSIKLLKRKWKKVQMLAYPAFVIAVVHIIIINPTVGWVLGPLFVVYAGLKVRERRHLKIKT